MPSVHGDDGAAAEPGEAAELLDAAYADWLAHLTSAQQDVLRRWQAPEARHYRAIQQAVRRGTGDHAILRDVEELIFAIESGSVPLPLTLWRGQRSARNCFGVDAEHLTRLAGTVQSVPGFLAATLDRAVAIEQFAQPPGPGGRLLLRLRVSSGTRAAWVAAAGVPALRAQFEVLLGPRHAIYIERLNYAEGVHVVEAEVL